MALTHEQFLDTNYRYQRHIYDLTRAYYLLGRDRLVAELQPPDGGTVLEVGSGTARNLIAAARRYPRARFFGVDLSRAMLETATRALAGTEASRRISLGHGDAVSFDPAELFGVAAFDRIYLSYAISMIPPWQAALGHARGLLAPGGSLHIVDFGPGSGLPAVANRALRAWLGKFHVSPRDELAVELARLEAGRGGQIEFRELFGGYAQYAVVRSGTGVGSAPA